MELEHYSKKIKRDISSFCRSSNHKNVVVVNNSLFNGRRNSVCSSTNSSLISKQKLPTIYLNTINLNELSKQNSIQLDEDIVYNRKHTTKKLDLVGGKEKINNKHRKLEEIDKNYICNISNVTDSLTKNSKLYETIICESEIYDSSNEQNTVNAVKPENTSVNPTQNIDDIMSPIIGNRSLIKLKNEYLRSSVSNMNKYFKESSKSSMNSSEDVESVSPIIVCKSKHSSNSRLTRCAPHVLEKTFSTDGMTRRRLFHYNRDDFEVKCSNSPIIDEFLSYEQNNNDDDNIIEEKLNTLNCHNTPKLLNINNCNKAILVESIKNKLNPIIKTSHFVKFGKSNLLENSVITNVSTINKPIPPRNALESKHMKPDKLSELSINIVDEGSEEFVVNSQKNNLKSSRNIFLNSPIISVGSASPNINDAAILEDSFHSQSSSTTEACTTFRIIQQDSSSCSPLNDNIINYTQHDVKDDVTVDETDIEDDAENQRCINVKLFNSVMDSKTEKINITTKLKKQRENIGNSFINENIIKSPISIGNDWDKSMHSPETCRDWLLKLHKTPQKVYSINDCEIHHKTKETPESASKKVGRNGFAFKLQRALAVWESRNNIRNYKKDDISPKDKINSTLTETNNKDKVTIIHCPNSSCRQKITSDEINNGRFSTKSLSNQVELTGTKEIQIQIAGCNFTHDPLPNNAAVAYIIENTEEENNNLLSNTQHCTDVTVDQNNISTQKSYKSFNHLINNQFDPINNSQTDPNSVNYQSFTNFDEQRCINPNREECTLIPNNQQFIYPINQDNNPNNQECIKSLNQLLNANTNSHSVSPCQHVLVVFFLQRLKNGPVAGEIYKIKPPWQQLLLPNQPMKVLFASNSIKRECHLVIEEILKGN